MHVLHRLPDLRKAALAAIAAAVLAIVLSLAIAGGLNDLSFPSTPANTPTSRAAVHAPTISPLTSNPLTHNPFTGPFTRPVRLPWAPAAP